MSHAVCLYSSGSIIIAEKFVMKGRKLADTVRSPAAQCVAPAIDPILRAKLGSLALGHPIQGGGSHAVKNGVRASRKQCSVNGHLGDRRVNQALNRMREFGNHPDRRNVRFS